MMYPVSVAQIVTVTGGEYFGDESLLPSLIASVTHDSREVKTGSLFVCIKGERADGHDFAVSAVESGALCCLSERRLPDGCPHVVVPSVMEALRRLAAHYRKLLPIGVVGIVGSVGKTTTKEMVASVLARRYNVLKTPANLNNELGVPMTVLSIQREHTAAVIEMGISDFGEMTRLSYMVRPDIALFTNIGHCHLEKLGDLEGVLRAKTEIITYMDYDAAFLANGDDEMLASYKPDMQKITFGFSKKCNFRAENVRPLGFDGTECDLVCYEGRISVKIPAFGEHIVYAALAASAVGFMFDVQPEDIAAGIAAYRPVGGRANVTALSGITLIDDCYNANPDSVSASLRSLAAVGGRRVAILGDMKELGAASAELHTSVGTLAGELGIDVLVTLGTEAANISAAFTSACGNEARHFDTIDALLSSLPEFIRTGDSVLVKASHSMKFEQISEKLRALYA